MVKRLYLLRHGRVDNHGRYIGSTDLPLLPEGIDDLVAVATYIHKQNIDEILCSPLLRCRQTMEVLNFTGQSAICPNLREIDFGEWEGMSFAEILQRDASLVEKWAVWSEDFIFPGGEGIRPFLQRIQKVRQKIDTTTANRLLVISHGGVIRQLVCSCLGLGPENYLAFDIQPGLLSVIELHPQGGVLVGLNQGK